MSAKVITQSSNHKILLVTASCWLNTSCSKSLGNPCICREAKLRGKIYNAWWFSLCFCSSLHEGIRRDRFCVCCCVQCMGIRLRQMGKRYSSYTNCWGMFSDRSKARQEERWDLLGLRNGIRLPKVFFPWDFPHGISLWRGPEDCTFFDANNLVGSSKLPFWADLLQN